MINFLRNWCEAIIVCVFISLIIEMLLPNGNIKKYIKVIIGIYIIFVILNPIISNINNIDFRTDLQFENDYNIQSFENTTEQTVNIYKKTIEENIKESCIGVLDVKVFFSDDLEEIEKIEIIAKENANLENIKKYIKENYNITDDVLSIIS